MHGGLFRRLSSLVPRSRKLRKAGPRKIWGGQGARSARGRSGGSDVRRQLLEVLYSSESLPCVLELEKLVQYLDVGVFWF